MGWKNWLLIFVGIALLDALLIWQGILYDTPLLSLSTAIGAKDATIVGGIFGRGYNKKIENGHGAK